MKHNNGYIKTIVLSLILVCVLFTATQLFAQESSTGGIATNPFPSSPTYSGGNTEMGSGGVQAGELDGPGGGGGLPGGEGGPSDIPFDSGVTLLLAVGIAIALRPKSKFLFNFIGKK